METIKANPSLKSSVDRQLKKNLMLLINFPLSSMFCLSASNKTKKFLKLNLKMRIALKKREIRFAAQQNDLFWLVEILSLFFVKNSFF